MKREDTSLEVVRDVLLPKADGLLYLFLKRRFGEGRGDAAVGFARGDEDWGLHHNDIVARKGEQHGSEDVSYACGSDGLVADEERAVGTQL